MAKEHKQKRDCEKNPKENQRNETNPWVIAIVTAFVKVIASIIFDWIKDRWFR